MPTETIPPLNGLLLCGGRSKRMGTDKGALKYEGKEQRSRAFELLSRFCQSVYFSCREEQTPHMPSNQLHITDKFEGRGPAGGLISAHAFAPHASWLVLACDLPLANQESIRYLLENRNEQKAATVYRDPITNILEPLFGIWEPAGLATLAARSENGEWSPRLILESLDCTVLFPLRARILFNVNTPNDYQTVLRVLNRV